MNFLEHLYKMEMPSWEMEKYLNNPNYRDEKIYNTYARPFTGVPRISTVPATEHPFLQGFRKTTFYKEPRPFEEGAASAFVNPAEKEAMTMFINLAENTMDKELRNYHEGDHLWTIRGERAGVRRDAEFAKRAGMPTGEFVDKIYEHMLYLKNKYPELKTIGYSYPEEVKKAVIAGRLTPYDVFNELIATLVALEMKRGIDITEEPVLKKHVFTPKVAEAYKSLTGWRATRWDSKDPPPLQHRRELEASLIKRLLK